MGFILSSVVNRKLEEANSQNRDLIQVISKREETIHSNQVRLEEKSRECSILTRQLEEALDDARRQVCTTTSLETHGFNHLHCLFFIEDTLLINRLPRPGSEQPLKSALHSPKLST